MTLKMKLPILLSIAYIITGSGCKKDSGNNGNGTNTSPAVTVSTIAGDGTDAYLNGAALSARFDSPTDVAVTANGTIYVADYNNRRIRKIANGQVTTYAGSGAFDVINDQGEMAAFRSPLLITADRNGNLYVLDQTDPRIRKISTTGYVTTYAGSNQPGYLNGGSLMAQFAVNAEGITTDAQGNVYIGDTFNDRIRKISTSSLVTNQAGTGVIGFMDGDTTVAKFAYPGAVATDAQGNIYVGDIQNHRIRKITPQGVVSTFAGTGVQGSLDGDRNTAQFDQIFDIAIDAAGNLYVASLGCIRKVTPAGTVSTIAGKYNTAGYVDGEGSIARFKTVGGIDIDAAGNLYVADVNNNRIRKITFQ